MVTDFGALSNENQSRRSIQGIAKKSLKPKRQAQILYRICNYFNPSVIIELGTSLGITSLYLSRCSNEVKVFTFEGGPNIIERAKLNLKEYGSENIEIIEGNIDDSLPQFLSDSPSIDVAFIDGNHQKKPTLSYFKQLKKKAHNDTLFILDDIHWSKGMEQAWEEIKEMESVSLTVDCFHFGLVFIKKELSKQEMTIRL